MRKMLLLSELLAEYEETTAAEATSKVTSRQQQQQQHRKKRSLKNYEEAVAALPRPSLKQIRNFVGHVCTAHSWYKHLYRAYGTPFCIYLNPTAGMRQRGRWKWTDYKEDDGTQFLARNWRTTQSYRESFGHLDYAYGEDLHERDIWISNVHGTPFLLPKHIQEACTTDLTAMCHSLSGGSHLLAGEFACFRQIYHQHLGLRSAPSRSALRRCPRMTDFDVATLKAVSGKSAATAEEAEATSVTLFVCMSNGLEVKVQAPLSDTINDLKRRIEAEKGIKWWAQMLFLDTTQLPNASDVSDGEDEDGKELPGQSTVGEQLDKLEGYLQHGQQQHEHSDAHDAPDARAAVEAEQRELRLTMLVDETALDRNLDWHIQCWVPRSTPEYPDGKELTEPTPTMVALMRDMLLLEDFNLAAAEAAGLGDEYKRVYAREGGDSHTSMIGNAEDDERMNDKVRKLKRQLLADLGLGNRNVEKTVAFAWRGSPPYLGSEALVFAQREREWRALEAAATRAAQQAAAPPRHHTEGRGPGGCAS